jgi:uncharacterized protein YlxW (UPF0749 family)
MTDPTPPPEPSQPGAAAGDRETSDEREAPESAEREAPESAEHEAPGKQGRSGADESLGEGDPDGAQESGDAEPPGRPRLVVLLAPRASRAQVVVGLLCLLLGFAVAAQVRSTHGDSTFATARQDELVGVLDNLTQRSLRLRSDIRELEQTKTELERDSRGDTAVEEARRRATTYGLLAGTVPATGPGIELTISDPGRKVRAAVLLDTLQELRDAGAEVVQINNIRVGVETYFLDAAGGGVTVDRQPLRPPYRFLVIGDPRTLAAALDIPGGVMETLRNTGATGRVTQRAVVEIHAVRSAGSAGAGTGN